MDKRFVDGCRKATLHFEQITPAIAEQWLKRNSNNYRNKSPSTSRKYTTDMRQGLWTVNTATIAFAENGEIIDGQHRLYAVLESGVSIWSYVLRNCPNEFIEDPNQDKGKPRDASTWMTKEGVKNATTVASALRCCYRIAVGVSANRNTSHGLTDAQVIAATPLLPESFFHAVNQTKALRVVGKLYAASVMATAIYLASAQDKESCEAFVLAMNKSTDEMASHPANVFREFCVANRKLISEDRFLDLFLTAFNLFLKGETRTILRCFARPEFSLRQRAALNEIALACGFESSENEAQPIRVAAAKRAVAQ